MLVMHGFWLPDPGLCLWAEDSELLVKSSSQAYRSARSHPFAAKHAALDGIHAGKPGEATLMLPSLRSAPLDSPELIRKTPRPPAQSASALLPWMVPVSCLDPVAALAALSERAPGIRYGASVSYLADLAEFAGELVARGRVLPALARDEDGAIARWRPVLSGPDVAAAHALTRAMPPVCRAVPGQDDPVELFAAALAAMVDVIARGELCAGPDLVPPRRGRRPERLSAIEAWLGALSAPEGRFDADPAELDALAEELAPWAGVGSGQTGPARATFRLTEAEAEAEEADTADGLAGSRWVLDFLLQSAIDPSLLVPAGQAWTDDGSLSRWLANPRELLLTELGRASRIYPELADGLRQPRPCGLDLDADGAYRFLSAIAPALDEAGFGVLLPSWWDRRRRLGLTASAHTPVDGVVEKASKFGQDQLMDFRWQLAVGDDTLTDDEIAVLAQAKAPLIRLRGQWVAVDPDQLRRGLEFLTREQPAEEVGRRDPGPGGHASRRP